ncbi:MAG: GDCCVxC domain-containing (seleno)protein [Thiobacillus sp.]
MFAIFEPQLTSNLTCPDCGVTTTCTMPTDACQWFFECPACAVLLKPKPGDCCVFCSYADVPCPPVWLARQADGNSCCV